MPTLIALAGPSRSGKGTTAAVAHEVAAARGLTSRERQLSGPGKQYVASAFFPSITEEEAIERFDRLKMEKDPRVLLVSKPAVTPNAEWTIGEVTLQQYLQRMLQGARDRWGTDFWTDKLLPLGEVYVGHRPATPGELSLDAFWGEPYPSGGPMSPPGYANWREVREKTGIPYGEPAWHRSFWQDGTENGPIGFDVAIISDLRQPNEAQRVKDIGGIVVELERPVRDDAYVTGRDHITEQRLPGHLVDHVLLNDSTVEDLRERAKDLLNDILDQEG